MAWASSGWLWAGSHLAAQLAQNSGLPWQPMALGWAISNTRPRTWQEPLMTHQKGLHERKIGIILHIQKPPFLLETLGIINNQ